jgi:hypothetical protein
MTATDKAVWHAMHGNAPGLDDIAACHCFVAVLFRTGAFLKCNSKH